MNPATFLAYACGALVVMSMAACVLVCACVRSRQHGDLIGDSE